LPHLLAGDMVKATQMIHTAKPPRPKPPRPTALPGTDKTGVADADKTQTKGAESI